MLAKFICAKCPREQATFIGEGLDFHQLRTKNFSWSEFHMTKLSEKGDNKK
jgi:hypothetical protein